MTSLFLTNVFQLTTIIVYEIQFNNYIHFFTDSYQNYSLTT